MSPPSELRNFRVMGGATTANVRMGQPIRRHRSNPSRSRDGSGSGTWARTTKRQERENDTSRSSGVVVRCVRGLAQPALPAPLRNIGVDQKLNALLPFDVRCCVTNRARRFEIGDYFGKRPVVLSLVYYKCPMLCDLVLNGMLRAFRTISLDAGKDFEVVTVSFDPRETPAFASAKKATTSKNTARPTRSCRMALSDRGPGGHPAD